MHGRMGSSRGLDSNKYRFLLTVSFTMIKLSENTVQYSSQIDTSNQLGQ